MFSSGELTLEEFISGAREHPDIMDMLTKMMDLTNVLEIIIMGQQKKSANWIRRLNRLNCVEELILLWLSECSSAEGRVYLRTLISDPVRYELSVCRPNGKQRTVLFPSACALASP